MNKALVGPIAALIVFAAKSILGIELEQEAVETAIDVVLTIVVAIGLFMNPKQQEKQEVDEDV